VEIH
jgi:hypothetical protein